MIKIAILNNSGNVGKTTICDNLFKHRIPNAEIIKIESINNDGTDDVKISAKDISNVLEQIAMADNTIIDVGSSNIESLMDGLKKMDDAHEDIDYFFIPTTPDHKQQDDTVQTVYDLVNSLDVEPDKIKIIFNKHDSDYQLEQQYSGIFLSNIAKMLEIKTLSNQFIIDDSPVFGLINKADSTFLDALNDSNDYRTMIRSTKDREERAVLSQKRTAQKMAKKFNLALDETFNKIANACQFDLDETVEEVIA